MRWILIGLLTSLGTAGMAQSIFKPFFGTHGSSHPDGSYQVVYLRTDLQIQSSSGMLIPPEMGLISKARFAIAGPQCRVDGELCVIRDEIDPVIDDLRTAGIELTRVGSRMAGEEPGVYFISFRSVGPAERLARAVKNAIDELGKDRLVSEGLNRTGHPPIVDWKAVSISLGLPVTEVGSSHVMLAETSGVTVNFGGCPCGRTMMFGELTLKPETLQKVIDVLRKGKISVTAIAYDDVNTVKLSFEGEGEAQQLAYAVHQAAMSRS